MKVQDAQIVITVTNDEYVLDKFIKDDKNKWIKTTNINASHSNGKVSKVNGEDVLTSDISLPNDHGQLRRIMNLAFRNALRQSKGE